MQVHGRSEEKTYFFAGALCTDDLAHTSSEARVERCPDACGTWEASSFS
jgi:hypothetical protein